MLKQSTLDAWNIHLENKNTPQAEVERYVAV